MSTRSTRTKLHHPASKKPPKARHPKAHKAKVKKQHPGKTRKATRRF